MQSGRILGGVMGALALLGAHAAHAQPGRPAWTLFLGGAPTNWRPASTWTPDSLAPAARDALAWLRGRGYAPRLDSAVVDSAGRLYASAPQPVRVRAVELATDPPRLAARLGSRWPLREGLFYADSLVRVTAAALVEAAGAAGYPLASVTPVVEDEGAAVRFLVDGGALLVLDRVDVGASEVRPAYVARVLGLRVGAPLRAFQPAVAADRLRETGLFRSVGAARVEVVGSRAVVYLPLDDAPPGAFDLVLGLLPPAAGGKASVVGTGSLALRNLFGAGYGLAVHLSRLPGQAATATAQASALFPLGLPVRLQGRFEGVQQDSAFTRQQYRAEAGYALGDVEVAGLLSLDRVRPGFSGGRLVATSAVGTRQPIARAEGFFTGVGLHTRRADDLVNPRRGYRLDLTAEVGRRARAFSEVTAAGVVRTRETVRQERAEAHARVFVPVVGRWTLATGADGWAVRGARLDEGDLIRLGGPTTLRGYDDDRFRARAAARALAEARFRLDRLSYAFAFADAAYLDRLAAVTDGTTTFTQEARTGYGLGLQLSTDVGLVTVTYAASPESGLAAGRIHLALSFGL